MNTMRERGACRSYLERISKHSRMSFFITFGMVPDSVEQMLAGMLFYYHINVSSVILNVVRMRSTTD